LIVLVEDGDIDVAQRIDALLTHIARFQSDFETDTEKERLGQLTALLHARLHIVTATNLIDDPILVNQDRSGVARINRTAWEELENSIGAIRDLRFVAIDPFGALSPDENNAVATALMGAARRTAERFDVHIAFTHHIDKTSQQTNSASKKTALRGSTALSDRSRSQINLSGTEKITLSVTKNNYGPLGRDITLHKALYPGGFAFTTEETFATSAAQRVEGDKKEQQLLDIIRERGSILQKRLIDEHGRATIAPLYLNEKDLKALLKWLVDQGKITRSRIGRGYMLSVVC